MLCPLCNLDDPSVRCSSKQPSNFQCPRCGCFSVTRKAQPCLGECETSRHLIVGLTRYHSEFIGTPLTVDMQLLDGENRAERLNALISAVEPKTIEEKLYRLILYLASKSKYPGDRSVWIQGSFDYPLAFCETTDEFLFYLSHMNDRGWLRLSADSKGCRRAILTAQGWERFEKIKSLNPESGQCFVAMSFEPSLDYIFTEGIEPIEERTGFRPLRIDRSEHNDKICDRIISEIKRSRFVIVDVSDNNSGAYFEAGYAMGLGLPVIFTAKKYSELHFDTRQYNHILWEDSEGPY